MFAGNKSAASHVLSNTELIHGHHYHKTISGQNQVINRGALRLCRGLDIVKLDTTLLIYNVSYFNLGGLEHCLGRLAHQISPWRRD